MVTGFSQPEENAGVNAELGFERGHGRLVSNGGGWGGGGGSHPAN